MRIALIFLTPTDVNGSETPRPSINGGPSTIVGGVLNFGWVGVALTREALELLPCWRKRRCEGFRARAELCRVTSSPVMLGSVIYIGGSMHFRRDPKAA